MPATPDFGDDDARAKPPIPRAMKTLDQWLKDGHGGAAIPDRSSLDWFIKKHRDRLLRSNSVFPGRGRRPTVVGPNFDRVVADIFGEENALLLSDEVSAHDDPNQPPLPLDSDPGA